jgi:hypothetical protein
MPTPPSRPSLDRATLDALLAATGLPIAPDEREALLPPTRALYEALDGLDALPLHAHEPAAHFHLAAE